MKTFHDFAEILRDVRYNKPGWAIELLKVKEQVFLKIVFKGACAETGRAELQHGRKWYLSPHMTRSEVVATAFKAILTAEEHEVREHFKYKGAAVFGPHFNVERLVELAGREDARDVRKSMQIAGGQ